MVWPILMGIARTYAPYIVWPFAFVIGVVGYNFETVVRGNRSTPTKPISIAEERDMRVVREMQDKDMTKVDSLKSKTFVPKTIFERNQ
jgi:UPF0767 family